MHPEVKKYVNLINKREEEIQLLLNRNINSFLRYATNDTIVDEFNNRLFIIFTELIRERIKKSKNNLRNSEGNKFYFEKGNLTFKLYKKRFTNDLNIITEYNDYITEYNDYNLNEDVVDLLDFRHPFVAFVNSILEVIEKIKRLNIIKKSIIVKHPFKKEIEHIENGYSRFLIEIDSCTEISFNLTKLEYNHTNSQECYLKDEISADTFKIALFFDDDYFNAVKECITLAESVLKKKNTKIQKAINELSELFENHEYNDIYISTKV